MNNSWLADKIPYQGFIDEGVVRLRGGGTMVGVVPTGLSVEGTSPAELEATVRRIGTAMGHLGTGDFLHVIWHRLEALDYPRRRLGSRAGQLIDDERRRQFAEAKYYRNLMRIYLSNQDESAAANHLKALLFGSTAERLGESQKLQRRRFLYRVQSWIDAFPSCCWKAVPAKCGCPIPNSKASWSARRTANSASRRRNWIC